MHEVPKLAALKSFSDFFLAAQVTVYISGSVTINLSGINSDYTEFQPNSTGIKLVSGVISDLNKLKGHDVAD